MSEFLALGLSLEDVVRRARQTPAEAIDREPNLGTLAAGAGADVAVMELAEEETTFVDTQRSERRGARALRAVATIRAGVPFGRPYGAPFSRI